MRHADVRVVDDARFDARIAVYLNLYVYPRVPAPQKRRVKGKEPGFTCDG